MAETVGIPTTEILSAFNRVGQEAVGSTGMEVLRNAGMDYRVAMRPIHDANGNAMDTGYRVITRTDTGQALGVTSKKYGIFQNSQMIDLIDRLCNHTGAQIDRIGQVDNGAKVFMSFRNPEGLSFANGDAQEDYDIYWYLISSHDGSTGLKMFPSPVRLFCNNQASILQAFFARNGIDARSLSIRHSNLLDTRVDDLLANFHLINNAAETFVEEASGLLSVNMGMADRIEYYINVLGLTQNEDLLAGGKDYDPNNPFGLGTRANNTLDVLMDLETSDTNTVGDMNDTAYQAYNVVTEYIDHRWTMDKDGKQLVENEKATESAVMGPGMRMKAKAYELLVA